MLAMASNGAEVLAAQSSCGAVTLTRLSPDLAILGRSPSFGHADSNAVELISTPTGWLLATSAGGTTEIFALGPDAGVPARATRIRNATPLAWAANADRTRFLLALRSPGVRYGGGLDVAIVAADGRVIAGPVAVFGTESSDSTDFTIAHAAQTTAVGAAFAKDAFFVARAQQIAGVEGPRIAVARIDPATGVPSMRTVAFDRRAWRPHLAWTGSELRLVYQTVAPPATPNSWGWALESIALDLTGHPIGPATTLAMRSSDPGMGGIGVVPIAVAPSGAWVLTAAPSSTGNVIVAPWMVNLSLIDASQPAPQTVLVAREPAVEYPAVAEARGAIVVGWLSRTGFGTPSTLTFARVSP